MSLPTKRVSRRGVAGSAVVLLAAACAFLVGSPRGARTAERDGREIFRFDTFGDEQLWTSKLGMHEVIQSAVSPVVALGVGLKVDSSVLGPNFLATHDLKDPATTVELIRRNAVVGLQGRVVNHRLTAVGVTCARCHSTVDNSVIPGVGRRLDGWPNRDLNPGAIIALSPAVSADQKAVYDSWGPGRYDPRFNIDGINGPVLIPPAYGLQHVHFETYTGDGPIAYWNNYVAVTQMGGHGSFKDPRLGLDIVQTPDLVRPRLPALVQYELTLAAPRPPAGSFDRAAARRGREVFEGAGKCATCHTPPTFTDVLRGSDPTIPLLHTPAETGMDPLYASRSATGAYRTSPLRGVWQHPPYFHDGSAATLADVVAHDDQVLNLGLGAQQKSDLVEFLKSL